MDILFMIIFAVSTVIHLYASKKRNQKLRNYTKPFILLSLLGYYWVVCQSPSIWLILALIFSWLGDVLLIGKGVKWFTAGGIAFLVSHIFFVVAYEQEVDFSKINTALCIAVFALYFVASIIEFKNLKDSLPRALFYPMFCYLVLNGTMNSFAFYRMLTLPNMMTIITFVGALGFYISDCRLFFVRFKKDGKERDHFAVMLAYSIGELLIVLGMI